MVPGPALGGGGGGLGGWGGFGNGAGHFPKDGRESNSELGHAVMDMMHEPWKNLRK